MNIVVLPFNAAANSRPALARQFANFASDIANKLTEGEFNAVNYLAQYQEDGVTRLALVNPTEELNELDMIAQFIEQAQADVMIDGLFRENEGGGGNITVRFFEKGAKEPVDQKEFAYLPGGALVAIRSLIEAFAARVGEKLPDEVADDMDLFGTDDEVALLKFLEGFDAIQYIEKSQGQVAKDFTPEPALQTLLEAVESDKDWEAPYMATVQLTRLCIQSRIGNGQMIETTLKKLVELEPEDGRGYFGLGELYQAIGDNMKASDAFEKAHTLEPDEPAILTRLGLAQLQAGMPVNAERNFRKAVDMEGEEKPSLDYLAQVLVQTGRTHEVPPLWKDVVETYPQNGQARAKYAISLLQAGKEPEATQAFETALKELEDNTVIKRFYAPLLAQKEELDRAMDYYEDCLDVAPADVPLLIEYAQTLKAADREFEVPKILRDVLAANPDPNTKAQTQAWLTEIEQPKRIEAVQSASKKADAGDVKGAIDELRPLRNWLADYWKMWAVLAAAHNQAGQSPEAEEAARKLLELYPGCEPGYGELVTALSAQGRDEEAYNIMRIAMSNMPNSLSIAINLAIAAKKAGHEDEARTLAKQIREATNGDENVNQLLSVVD